MKPVNKPLPKPTKKQHRTMNNAYDDFHVGMLTRAQYKTSNKWTSEDLVQNTFLKTWRYLLLGGKIDTMKAFLYHILNNLIVDEYRKRKYTNTSLDAMLEKGYEPSTGNPHDIMNRLDGKAALLLIVQLPEKYQKMLRMRYVQSLSIREISQLTGLSKNAVAVQLHRAVKKLGALFTPNE
jgi:RNA polymerase sigma-70 factor, ECF subfamily